MIQITLEQVRYNLIDNDGVDSFELIENGISLYIDIYEEDFICSYMTDNMDYDYTHKVQIDHRGLEMIIKLINEDLKEACYETA